MTESEEKVVLVATDAILRFFQKHPELCPHTLTASEGTEVQGDEVVRTIHQTCIVCGYKKIHVVRTKNN